ncbi:MAG: hypothetical protein V1663_03405 [archaeon]
MKKLLIFLVLLISVSSAYAAFYDVSYEDVNSVILPGQKAIFNVNIRNLQAISDTATFVLSDLDWEWEKKNFNLPIGGQTSFQLELTPPENTVSGRHALTLKVYSLNNPENYVYDNLLVDVLPYENVIGVEGIETSLPEGLDPRKTNKIKLLLKNKYNIDINDVYIELRSELFNKEFTVDFEGAELKEIEFDVDIDPDTIEGEYDINVVAKLGLNKLLDDKTKLNVVYYSDVKSDVQESTGFLVKDVYVHKRNDGNSVIEQEYSLRLGSFEKIFTYADIEPTYKEKRGDGYYYIWNFELQPGQEYNVHVRTNYRDPLLVLIILGLIFYILYYNLTKKVTLKKKILTLKSNEGISEMKVLLILKNPGKKTIKTIRLVDQLHNIVKVPDTFGSLKPSSIKKYDDRVVLVWDIDNIIGGEERVISYKVKAEVNIIGRLTIPRALCRYRKGNRTVIVRSNNNSIYS